MAALARAALEAGQRVARNLRVLLESPHRPQVQVGAEVHSDPYGMPRVDSDWRSVSWIPRIIWNS